MFFSHVVRNFRSMLARDLQSIVLYDQEGKFVGVRRPNSNLPIEIDGTKILIVDAIGSSGLDLKVKGYKFIAVCYLKFSPKLRSLLIEKLCSLLD